MSLAFSACSVMNVLNHSYIFRRKSTLRWRMVFWCIVNSVFKSVFIKRHFSAILMMSLSDFDIRVILFFLSHVVSCVKFAFCCCGKDHDQRQLGRKGFIWHPKQSPLLKKVKPGTQGGQRSWGRAETKPGGTLHTNLNPRLTSATLLYKLWEPAREGHCQHQSLINRMLHRYAHRPIW